MTKNVKNIILERNNTEIINKYDRGIEVMSLNFELSNGEKISYCDELREYNEIHIRLFPLVTAMVDGYEAYYDKSNIDDFFKPMGKYTHGYKPIISSLSMMTDEIVKIAILKKNYDIDRDTLLNKYGDEWIRPWDEACLNFLEKYAEIILEGENEKQYREFRKMTRSQSMGVGVGFSGVIQSAVATEAANAITGLMHGTFNFIANARTNARTNAQKIELYKKEKERILNAFSKSLIVILDNVCVFFNVPIRPGLDSARSESIGNNIKAKMIPYADIPKCALKMLEHWPYGVDGYGWYLAFCGDRNLGLQSMADFFGCGDYLRKLKHEHLLDDYLEFDISDYRSMRKALDDLNEKISYYGLGEVIYEEKSEFRAKLVELKRKCHNVGGVYYDDLDDAMIANDSIELIETMLKQYKEKIHFNLQDIIREIEKLPLPENTISENVRKRRIIDYLEVQRTNLNSEIKRLEEAKDFTSGKEVIDLSNLLLELVSKLETDEELEKRMVLFQERLKNFCDEYQNIDGIYYANLTEAYEVRNELKLLEEIERKYDPLGANQSVALIQIVNEIRLLPKMEETVSNDTRKKKSTEIISKRIEKIINEKNQLHYDQTEELRNYLITIVTEFGFGDLPVYKNFLDFVDELIQERHVVNNIYYDSIDDANEVRAQLQILHRIIKKYVVTDVDRVISVDVQNAINEISSVQIPTSAICQKVHEDLLEGLNIRKNKLIEKEKNMSMEEWMEKFDCDESKGIKEIMEFISKITYKSEAEKNKWLKKLQKQYEKVAYEVNGDFNSARNFAFLKIIIKFWTLLFSIGLIGLVTSYFTSSGWVHFLVQALYLISYFQRSKEKYSDFKFINDRYKEQNFSKSCGKLRLILMGCRYF